MRAGADTVGQQTDEPDQITDQETGWFVYGVTDAGVPVPSDLAGLDSAPVVAIASGRVAAVVTEVAIQRPPGRGADLLGYHGVLDGLAHRGVPVLPVSFGSVLLDEQDVGDFLAADEAWFAELLDGLRGREQFLFQASYEEKRILAEVVAAEPEIAALREHTKDLPTEAAYGDRVRLGELVGAAVEHRRTIDAERLLDVVVPLSESHVLKPAAGLERVVDVALLVAAERRGELETRLEALAEEVHPRLRLRLMGPTAPYDFAGGA